MKYNFVRKRVIQETFELGATFLHCLKIQTAIAEEIRDNIYDFK